jgi:hypothetical protein
MQATTKGPAMQDTATYPAGPLAWTTARWFNGDDGAKILAHYGSYGQFAYGTDTPSTWPYDLQLAIVCSPASGVIAIDVDDAELFKGSRTARIVSREDACTVRDDHFHIVLDARGIPRHEWPRQGRAGTGPGAWGDIKSNGFVPAPGCRHHTGHLYAVTGRPAVLAAPALITAIRADRASYTPPAGHGGGGRGGSRTGSRDHDTARMVLIMHGILEGKSEDEIRELWDAAPDHYGPAPGCSSAKRFTNKDFARHWRSASRYAAEILAREERDRHWAAAILGRTR